MKKIHDIFDIALKQRLQQEKILVLLFKKKMKNIGIELTQKQLNFAEAQFEKITRDEKENFTFSIDFSEEQIKEAGYDKEADLLPFVENFFSELPQQLAKFQLDLDEGIYQAMNETVEKIGRSSYIDFKKAAKVILKNEENIRIGFIKKNEKKWKKSFHAFELMITASFDVGAQLNEAFNKREEKSEAATFDALRRLHARACQITKEVLVLLKNGFADGAHARWRTLHEISVVSALIKEFGHNLAEPYLLHINIEEYKTALLDNKFSQENGLELLSADELNNLKEKYDNLIERYGDSYKHEYGWAAKILKINKPNFTDLEKAADFNQYRVDYKIASSNIHANPKGALYRLGLENQEGVLLAGPSDFGLSWAGKESARSLSQITLNLLLHEEDLDNLILAKSISMFANDAI